MKTVLNIDTHETFGALLAKIIKSGVVPEYYDEFLKHFERIALGAVKERNRPGTGHGQGPATVEVPRSLAQFALHLAAVTNRFLIDRWLEQRPSTSASEIAAEGDSLPF